MCCYNNFYTKELIGVNLALAAKNYHSVTVISTLGIPILQVEGSDDVNLPVGVSVTMTATELIENKITIVCGTSGDKAIVIYNN